MSKIALLLGVCLTLSACMIYAPSYVNDTQNTVVHYESTSASYVDQQQKTAGVPEREKTKVTQKRVERTLADCDAFTLPRDAHKPKYYTDAEFALAENLPAFDTMVAKKLKELQTYIDSLPSKYEQAHQKWLEACTNKLLH